MCYFVRVFPASGGDVMEFKKLQEACDILVTKLEEDEKLKL